MYTIKLYQFYYFGIEGGHLTPLTIYTILCLSLNILTTCSSLEVSRKCRQGLGRLLLEVSRSYC